MFRSTLALLFLTLFASVLTVLGGPIEKRNSGRGTYYAVGLGACGVTNNDNQAIVALNTADYAGGAHCGQTISITANGKTHSAQVMDLCPGCAPGGIDMSPSLFESFASLDVGVLQVQWSFA
ncbi:hypothetical protein DENSPDRAFT_879826 [Dentipellis sp. KUC8613]|nr:hypothetical protein DENSPDRAFT_879826 [Dentipellis sp. KUC8613]